MNIREEKAREGVWRYGMGIAEKTTVRMTMKHA
jgi:hypothetical protein